MTCRAMPPLQSPRRPKRSTTNAEITDDRPLSIWRTSLESCGSRRRTAANGENGRVVCPAPRASAHRARTSAASSTVPASGGADRVPSQCRLTASPTHASRGMKTDRRSPTGELGTPNSHRANTGVIRVEIANRRGTGRGVPSVETNSEAHQTTRDVIRRHRGSADDRGAPTLRVFGVRVFERLAV